MNANNKLLILGAGQYGQVAKEIAESMGCFEKIDFLDDGSEFAIDKLSNYGMYAREYSYATVAIGNADIRLEYIQKLEDAFFKIAILVSPHAYVAPSAELRKGTIIEPMAVVNTGAVIGTGVIVCAGVIVNHNAAVGDGCLLQCGSILAARTHLKPKSALGYNEVCETSDGSTNKYTFVENDYT